MSLASRTGYRAGHRTGYQKSSRHSDSDRLAVEEEVEWALGLAQTTAAVAAGRQASWCCAHCSGHTRRRVVDTGWYPYCLWNWREVVGTASGGHYRVCSVVVKRIHRKRVPTGCCRCGGISVWCGERQTGSSAARSQATIERCEYCTGSARRTRRRRRVVWAYVQCSWEADAGGCRRVVDGDRSGRQTKCPSSAPRPLGKKSEGPAKKSSLLVASVVVCRCSPGSGPTRGPEVL